MSFRAAFLLSASALLAAPAAAMIAPSSPVSSSTCTGGKACLIQWQDDGTSPSAASFGQTTIGLYVGNALQQTLLQSFGTYDPSSTTSIEPVIDATCGDDSDEYFIRFQSVSATDSSNQPLEAFSAKFTLQDMTGTFSSAVQAQMAGVTSAGEAQGVVTATGGAAATASALTAGTTTVSSSSPSSSHSSNSTDAASAAAPARGVYLSGLAGAAVVALGLTLAV